MHNRFGGKQLFDRYCAKVTTEIEGQPLEGWWIASPGRARNLAEGRSGGGKSYTLLYLPGGGFVMGGPTFYLEFLHKLRIALSLSHPSLGDVAIFAASYPLVPEHTHPAQAESARRTWSYLASHPGVDPARLSAAGDSAGGHLALGLRLAVGNTSLPDFELYEGLPLPHQLMCVCCLASSKAILRLRTASSRPLSSSISPPCPRNPPPSARTALSTLSTLQTWASSLNYSAASLSASLLPPPLGSTVVLNAGEQTLRSTIRSDRLPPS